MEEELREIRDIAINNSKAIEEHNSKFEEQNQRILNNFDKIQQNAYGIEILRDYKKSNQRLYFLIILLIVAIIILGLHHLI